MFLHINHDHDQMWAMRHIAEKEVIRKIELLKSSPNYTEKELLKLEKLLSKSRKIRNDDFMVFDYLKYAIGENNYFESIFIDGKKYVWISRKKLMNDLSILDIKNENNVSTLITQYEEMGILEKHTVKGQKSKVFLTFTDLASRVLGKTMDDREFVREILIKMNIINKNNHDKKTITKNPQPPKQPTEQKDKPKDKLTQFRDLIMDNMRELKVLSIGETKVNKTDKTKANFKAISNEAMFSMEQLAKEYAEYVNRNRGKSVRLDKWLLAYMERNLNDIEYAKDFSTTSSTKPLTDLDKEAIKKLEEIKKELPKIAIEENKILCNMEEVNALRAWREKNPTFYKELLGVDAKGEINLKDSAYVRHAIKEQGYAKKFLTFVVNYTGRYGKVA